LLEKGRGFSGQFGVLRKNFAVCTGILRIVKSKDVKAAGQVTPSTKIRSAYKMFDGEACKTIINFSTGALEIGYVLTFRRRIFLLNFSTLCE
jgi:hypothetical protein